ncbi:hypothetical protein PSTT_11330, partial [Puccinia striiformis]
IAIHHTMDFSSVPTTARNHNPQLEISITQVPPQVDISTPGKVATEVALQVEPAKENADEVQLDEQHPLIPAPPEQSFGSRDECFESIQTWARINRFAISTARSYTVNDEVRVIYRCDKSGVYRPHRKKKKDSTEASAEENGTASNEPATGARKPAKGPPKNANKSRKTNCPFKMVLTHNPTTKMWDLVVDEAAHNHAPSDHPSAHYMHRRFTIEQKSTINKWTNAGVMPLKVKNGMMQDTSTPLYANLRAFHNLNYNERQKDPEANSKEDYEQQFLQEVFERFQKLPTHKKPGYLANFTRLLDQTHSLTQIEDPLEQTHKGRSRGPTKKKPLNRLDQPKGTLRPLSIKYPRTRWADLASSSIPLVGDPPKGRGRPRKETGPSVGTKRKQVTGTVKGNKKNKRSASKSESGSASETDGMNASDLPEVPLDIVTRSGRVINRPSKSGATTVKPMVEKEKNESDSDIDSDEYLPDAPQAVPNDCDKEKPQSPCRWR